MTSSSGAALEALREELERRFRVERTTVQIAGETLVLAHPASADELIDEREFDVDERLPYWADLWPSARVLAAYVARLDGAGARLLELGCGIGLVATTAARRGFAVTATDYYEDSLNFTRVNVAGNGGTLHASRLADWRRFPTDLGRFDLIVGSDVLYEPDYGELVARTIDVTLGARGEAVIADPGRVAAASFVSAAARRGLRLVDQHRVPWVDGQITQRIDVYRLARG